MIIEMENPRRPFDRSRDPGPMKKPRLAEESVRTLNPTSARPLPSQRQVGSVTASASRFRANGREAEGNNDPSREAYQPQPINPQHELVSQYKLAISELTLNSKPIITNLTIIAGENLHAGKAIANTICNNILEVPNEKKLPSLYLLDSIVKNIGRDYIKYFAARLPEVFIKAYRQVDPSVHQSMRHLFGTWKGVFHPQTLQMIEKEFGFASRTVVSSAVVPTSRTDPQPHSIHVNPKYLERQHLQQCVRAKGMVDDAHGLIASSPRDTDSLERTSSVTARASWIDPSVKLNSIKWSQRETLSEPLYEPLYEKDIGATTDVYEYGSGLPQKSRLGIKKIGGRITEEGLEKPWYAARSGVPEMISSQPDGLNTKNRSSNYSTARSANADLSGASRSSINMSNSWKNPEEEEFMWDMHSRLSENNVANISSNSKNVLWTPDESEKLESENHLLRPQRVQEAGSRFDPETSADSYSSELKDQTGFGHWTSSGRKLQDLTRPGLSTPNLQDYSSTARKGIQPQVASSHVGTSNSAILPKSAAGSVRQSHVNHSTSLHNSAKEDFRRSNSLPHRDPRTSQFSGKPQSISNNFESLSTIENASGLSNPLTSEVSGQSNMSSLLVVVMKTGVLSNNLKSGGTKDKSFEDKEKPIVRQSGIPHSSPGSNDNTSARIMVEQPPLPPGLSPSSLPVIASRQTSNEKNKASDPISSLLSSLVSKGLISASKTESPSLVQPQKPSTMRDQSPDNSTNSSVSISAVPSDVQPTPSVDKGPYTTPNVTGSSAPSEPAKVSEVENLIGFQFRPDVIREFHPSVISSLFSNLPHQCSFCGIHLKHKEQLDRHLELHDKQKLESNNGDRLSSFWYAKADDWVSGKPGQLEPESATSLGKSERATKDEPMVPADENQYACILCSEVFEDYFSEERDQWMFKGAVHMANTDANGPIVHANCFTESSVHDLGFGSGIKGLSSCS